MSSVRREDAARLDFAGPLALDQTSLFLDIDGTLAPIMARPADVGPLARRTALLQTLAKRLGGRLAVISGRGLSDIDRILDGAVVAAAGVHGLQRRSADGRVHQAEPHPALATISDDLTQLVARLSGLLIEHKGLSVAIHYRAEPQAATVIQAEAERIAARTGLALQGGDMVVELRTPGFDKGDAVAAFMNEAPFAGAQPVFVGDDLTDEAGFKAASDLQGYGVLVGPARPTLARRRLADPDAVLAWLGEAALADINS